MATGTITTNQLQDFIIYKTNNGSLDVPASEWASSNLTLETVPGYTPVGVGGFNFSGQVRLYGVYVTGNKLYVAVRNTTGSKITGFKPNFQVMYIKN